MTYCLSNNNKTFVRSIHANSKFPPHFLIQNLKNSRRNEASILPLPFLSGGGNVPGCNGAISCLEISAVFRDEKKRDRGGG
jgi:hypothetical protein